MANGPSDTGELPGVDILGQQITEAVTDIYTGIDYGMASLEGSDYLCRGFRGLDEFYRGLYGSSDEQTSAHFLELTGATQAQYSGRSSVYIANRVVVGLALSGRRDLTMPDRLTLVDRWHEAIIPGPKQLEPLFRRLTRHTAEKVLSETLADREQPLTDYDRVSIRSLRSVIEHRNRPAIVAKTKELISGLRPLQN